MNTEHQSSEIAGQDERDRLETIYDQLVETEQALKRTLEFFDRIAESELASRAGIPDIRTRLLRDLERLAQERNGSGSPHE